MSNIERLAYIKGRLRNKLQARAFFKERIAPCAELFSAFQEAGITFQIAGWIGFEEAWPSHLVTEMQELPYEFDTEDSRNTTQLLDKLFEQYPSVNPLRYVPPLKKIIATESGNPIKKGIKQLQLQDQNVFIYFLQYAPLLQLKLYDTLKLDEGTVFNFWNADAVIFPEDLTWLISFSLEEEWYAGRAFENASTEKS